MILNNNSFLFFFVVFNIMSYYGGWPKGFKLSHKDMWDQLKPKCRKRDDYGRQFQIALDRSTDGSLSAGARKRAERRAELYSYLLERAETIARKINYTANKAKYAKAAKNLKPKRKKASSVQAAVVQAAAQTAANVVSNLSNQPKLTKSQRRNRKRKEKKIKRISK